MCRDAYKNVSFPNFMKIDSTKSGQNTPREKQTVGFQNAEITSNLASGKNTGFNTAQPQRDFAVVLKSTNRQDGTPVADKETEKTNTNKQSATEESESSAITKEKEKLSKEKRDGSDTDSKSDAEQEDGFGQVSTLIQNKISEINLPGARSILHIADMERIISSIRSETMANGKQITIELKNSIFQGLELKLTIGKNKNVVAEFFAATESVKNLLSAKAEELATLLRDRGIKLTKLEINLSSDSNQKEKHQNFHSRQTDPFRKTTNRVGGLTESPTDTTNQTPGSDISYQI